MLKLRLDCRWEVSVSGFHMSRTYGGLLEGRPSAGLNAHIVARTKSTSETFWGKRALYVVPPKITYFVPLKIHKKDRKCPCLPPNILFAWLKSSESLGSSGFGSELVVIWFADDFQKKTFEEIVFDGVRGVPWKEVAEDWDP